MESFNFTVNGPITGGGVISGGGGLITGILQHIMQHGKILQIL